MPTSTAHSTTPATGARGAPDDALSSQTAYDADIGGAGVTKGSGAFTVASSGLATVNSLDIGAANATLALTGGTFTVDNIQSGVGGASIAVDLGAINVSASATLAFGTIADSAVPLANGADNYAYSGELLDTGGALNIAAGGALQIDEPRFKFLSNGKAGVVTLAGDAVIQGATTIGDTLENVNNLIQGAGTIGNGAGSGSAVEGGLVLQNDAAGVIDANAATAMTIDTGAEKDENSGLIETTGAGGLIIDSDIAQNGLLIAAGTGAISINDAHVGGNRGNDIVQSGGRIVLNGSQLTTGGTISVAAGGTITTVAGADDNLGVASNNAGVGDDLSSGAIENSGTIEIANGTTLNLDGSVYNNGAGSRIWLDGATSATTLEIYGGGAAIYGAGALVMSNSENNAIVANGAAEQLGVYGTISGAGVIDGGGTDDLLRLYVATTGVVNANDADAMTIYGDSAAADAGSESADYNAGLIETTGTGGLTIDIDAGLERSDPTSGTDFGNVGAIDATGSGALVLENGTLLGGGVLQTTAAGATIILDNLVSAENSVKIVKGSLLETTAGDGGDLLANLANYGTVAVVAGSTLEARHSWLNAGTVELHGSSASQLSTLEVSDLTLTGGGTVNLNAYGTIAGAQTGADGGEAWLNNMSDTILGSGVIGALDGDTDLSLQNFGTIDATGGVAQTMTIDTGAQAIGNDGTIETTAAGGLTIIGAQGTNFSQGGGLYQDGSLIAEGSGALTLEDIVVSGDGSYDVAKSGASIVLDGSSVAGGVFTLVAGGELIARSGTSDQLVAKSNIANAGAIWVQGGATLELDGKISDASTGAIDIGDANGAATLKIDGYGARITGGAITLSDNAGNRIVSGESDEYLWSSATITGDGTIGDADLSFQNLSGGVVDANDSGGLTLVADIANNGLQMAGNSGVIETTGAGNLMIDGALDAGAQNFSNSGLIDEAGWGTLTLNAIDDAAGGGTVEATGTGKLVLEDDSLISVGVVSVAARATIATTSGDSDDAIEANMSLSGDVDVADRSSPYRRRELGGFGLDPSGDRIGRLGGYRDLFEPHVGTAGRRDAVHERVGRRDRRPGPGGARRDHPDQRLGYDPGRRRHRQRRTDVAERGRRHDRRDGRHDPQHRRRHDLQRGPDRNDLGRVDLDRKRDRQCRRYRRQRRLDRLPASGQQLGRRGDHQRKRFGHDRRRLRQRRGLRRGRLGRRHADPRQFHDRRPDGHSRLRRVGRRHGQDRPEGHRLRLRQFQLQLRWRRARRRAHGHGRNEHHESSPDRRFRRGRGFALVRSQVGQPRRNARDLTRRRPGPAAANARDVRLQGFQGLETTEAVREISQTEFSLRLRNQRRRLSLRGFPSFAPLPRHARSPDMTETSLATPLATPASLAGATRAELVAALAEMGVPERETRMRASQLWHWIYHRGVQDFAAMKNIARPLLERLAEHHTLTRPEIVAEQVSADGTRKWLLRMPSTGQHDRGAEIECVYIPESDRGTLCVSSQVGCTLNCTFCHTGTQKWVRNLTTAEIVGQVLVARDRLGDFPGGVAPTDGLVPSGEGVRAVSNIVFMGMGEPLYNIDNVARRDRRADRRRRAFALQAPHHGLDLGRRARNGQAGTRMRHDARRLAARDQQRAARRTRAAQQEISDRGVAEGLPRLSRRLERAPHHVRICNAEGRQRHAGRGARAGAPAQGPAREDQPDPVQSLARQPLRMLGLGGDRAVFRHRVQCRLREPGAHAARPRHPRRLRPVEERDRKAARPRAPDARGEPRRWPGLILGKATLRFRPQEGRQTLSRRPRVPA